MVEVRLVLEGGERLAVWYESDIAAPRPSYSVNGGLFLACSHLHLFDREGRVLAVEVLVRRRWSRRQVETASSHLATPLTTSRAAG